MSFITRLFRKKQLRKPEIKCITFNGSRYGVYNEYAKFLKEGTASVICTSLCKDFEKYNHTEQFILIVTYELKCN